MHANTPSATTRRASSRARRGCHVRGMMAERDGAEAKKSHDQQPQRPLLSRKRSEYADYSQGWNFRLIRESGWLTGSSPSTTSKPVQSAGFCSQSRKEASGKHSFKAADFHCEIKSAQQGAGPNASIS